ncbi:MAG: hypothetical protein EA425_15750 [Puniceicoccaceae bacterium]|nr:MAG: hypothetical protein EA425_15750 [Puniceicoccaceae bacterium]
MALPLSASPALRFDFWHLILDGREPGRLVATGFVFFLPFFFGALVLVLVLDRRAASAGHVYAANLAGSAGGGLLGLLLLERIGAVTALPVLAVLAAGAGCLLASSLHLRIGCLVTALALPAMLFFSPPSWSSTYKDRHRLLLLPDSEVIFALPSMHGKLEGIRSPAIRFAPATSLRFTGEAPAMDLALVDGDAAGPLPHGPSDALHAILDHAPSSLPYDLGPRHEVLLLGGPVFAEALYAAHRGASGITLVLPHPRLARVGAERITPLPNAAALDVIVADPATVAARTKSLYDLIVLPEPAGFGADAGTGALGESPLFTVEILAATIDRLRPGGLLLATSPIDHPTRLPLRLVSTLQAALEASGRSPAAEHFALLRTWSHLVVLVRADPWPEDEWHRLAERARHLNFDLIATESTVPPVPTQRYHADEDDSFTELLQSLLDPASLQRLLAAYPFQLAPPTRDRPYFHQSLRWTRLREIIDAFGWRDLVFSETGSIAGLLTAVATVAAAFVLILLPLLRLGFRGRERLPTVGFFLGIGLGYLFLQMVLIHRMTIYWGHPVPAAAGVITALLLAMGFGSLIAGATVDPDRLLRRITLAIPVLLLAVLLFLPPLLSATLGWSAPWRWLLGLSLLIILGLPLGMPFVLGLRRLRALGEQRLLPWAWGIDGAASVAGAALASVVAAQAGFTVATTVALSGYLLAWLSIPRR